MVQITGHTRFRVRPLAGGASFDAAAIGMDPLRSPAFLACHIRLPTVTGQLAGTDQVLPRVKVTVAGDALWLDNRSAASPRCLDAFGEWTGEKTREDAVPLGRMTSRAVAPVMSAPLIRQSDGAMAAVMSGRYNGAAANVDLADDHGTVQPTGAGGAIGGKREVADDVLQVGGLREDAT